MAVSSADAGMSGRPVNGQGAPVEGSISFTVKRSTLTKRPRAMDPSGRVSTTKVLCASPCGRTLMGTTACSENSSCAFSVTSDEPVQCLRQQV